MINKVSSIFMDNKQDLLLAAIESYANYTPVQRKILRCIAEISVDNVAVVSPDMLAKMVGTTRSTIYPALKLFREDNFFISDHKRKERSTKLKFNEQKLDEVITRFQKQQNFTSK